MNGRRLTWFLLVASLAALLVAVSPALGAPPVGLTPFGRIAWNLEGLLQRTLGPGAWCEGVDQKTGNRSYDYTRAACKLPLAFQVVWYPLFAPHTATAFILSARSAPNLGNVAPIRITGHPVKCSASNWLVLNGTGALFCTSP
jgi:hypothetical protein